MRNKTKPDKSRQAEERGEKVAAGFSLRKSAEEHLSSSTAKDVESEVYGDMRKLIHELQVHQIELEMQNEELRKAQGELQKSRDNYFDFYNFSPVGYFTFDEKGLILDLSLTSATLLNVEKPKLIGKNFRLYLTPASRPSFNTFCKRCDTDKKQTCELKLDALTQVLMEGISIPDEDEQGKRIRAVMIDITERKGMEEELRRNKEMLEKAMKDVFHVLMSTIEKRMSQTPKHRQRVVDLAVAIAGEMGFSGGCIEGISMAGPILDLGYIAVPGELLSKPLGLTDIESQLVKTHVQIGHEIIRGIEFPWPLAEIVLQHHERVDGSGYPRGLKGDDILLEAKILAVADTVEGMCCAQPYRPGLGIDKALEEIEKNKGALYDANVVEACVKLFRQKRFSFE